MCDNYEEYLTTYIEDSSKLALLLDYDGTLTPIVAHPDLATIPPQTKSVLHSLSLMSGIFVAIISGRNVNNVKEMVGIDNITYAGNHGLEVLYPNGTRYVHQLPTEFNRQVNELIQKLENSVVRDGAWIENKGASLTFHFRATPENLRNEIEKTAQKIIEDANFKVGKAHCALEARPKVDWNKGKVALLILNNEYGENWSKNVKVVFAGDDTTDEDAMRALKGNAATFRISSSLNVETCAEKLLSSTEAVRQMLIYIEKLMLKNINLSK
ncbi:probable trehalose-phosphate phosphatase 1 [Anoplophora glabripennis]|uniref:probable trehalose-phosphate phosphatase 1 n=1 Tax=Anoplophora glabripennis TaxID=217634 RepID=UPI000874165B|nr:probable trehalose-phosphate phosphatase 1 [Anoplophora glabripennis]